MQDSYVCEMPNCGKRFSRADHLSRHMSIHNPRQFFFCELPGCSKKFVRKDVRDKHEQRHRLKNERIKSRRGSVRDQMPNCSPRSSDLDTQTTVSTNIINEQEDSTSLKYQTIAQKVSQDSNIEFSDAESTKFVPMDLTQWLFNDEAFLIQNENSSPTNPFLTTVDSHAAHILEDAFLISPNFPHPNYQTNVDVAVTNKLQEFIPALKTLPFGPLQVERTLEIYWAFYHVQFPILHRPSFHTSQAHPLLLLSMIMMGAALSSFTENDEYPILGDAAKLVEAIAFPLRWLISSSEEFSSPAKAWILQALVILETCEILFSSRKLHERAYLHHGAKIQLLRRSPLLGGDPAKTTNDDDDLTEETDLWKRWIEVESLNRVALVSFYLDTINATIFGHQIVLFAHQIKLAMPCDDMIWEMSSIDKNNLPPQTQTQKFITAMTKLLHQEKLEVGPLGKKVLLAGLLSIKFQMELKDLQVTFLDWNSIKDSWKDTLYDAIEVWHKELCHDDCCDSRNAFYLSKNFEDDIRNCFTVGDLTCKFPVYHISQTFMGIKQYDCIIYAGAANRMNVKTTEKDYIVVKDRITAWARSSRGRISVLHCYIFLKEILFRGEEDAVYDPSTDPIFHRPNIVASSLFVIWAYNYCLFGPEFEHNTDIPTGHLRVRENGYIHMRRILNALGIPVGKTSKVDVKECAEIITQVQNTNHVVGLMVLFKDRFKHCQSEVCREYEGLLENCIARSMGHPRPKLSLGA